MTTSPTPDPRPGPVSPTSPCVNGRPASGRRKDVHDPVAELATVPSVRLDPQARREAAVVVAGWALEQDAPQEWLTDVLGYLGLLDLSLARTGTPWPWLSERDRAVLAAWLAEQAKVAA